MAEREPAGLLDGEDLTSFDPEDVRHWCAVYRELMDFAESRARDTSGTDAAPLWEVHADRYRGRLAVWQARAVAPMPPE